MSKYIQNIEELEIYKIDEELLKSIEETFKKGLNIDVVSIESDFVAIYTEGGIFLGYAEI